MGLLSIFKRAHKDGATADSASRASANTTSASAAPSVHQARTRARRRLIGASLLVLMGIVAFPILFESQPRPVPVDIPIDIPRAEDAPPLRIPPAVSSAPAPTVPAARSQVVVVEPPVPANAGASTVKPPEVVAVPAAEAASKAAAAKAVADKEKADKEKADKAEKDKAKEAEKASRAAAQKASVEAARAKALLEGKEAKTKDTGADGSAKAAAPPAGRFVVQVGAYADAEAAKDVRKKVEKLGLKTYTQVVDTSAGSRTRVRVGPMESKEQADKVLERLKAAGLSAVVLTL